MGPHPKRRALFTSRRVLLDTPHWGELEGPAQALNISGKALSFLEVESVARDRVRVELDAEGRQHLEISRAALEEAMRGGEAIYGVNTGFGSLAGVRIGVEDLREVQRNLILSHA